MQMDLIAWVVLFSGLAFFVYGYLSLVSESRVLEFEELGISHLRVLIGLIELTGGIALLFGLLWPPAILAASAGLSGLMVLGVGLRVKMKNKLQKIAPAFTLMGSSFYIMVDSWPHS